MRAFASLALLMMAHVAAAQTPTDTWRTVTTEHYRVHYPLQAEAWALDAASQLDDVRRRVVEEVGYAPPQVVDVLVVDPLSSANGLALPTLGSPRMMLFATPPMADSVIGHYRSWGELLTTHEDAHLVHLLRPSRNPLVGMIDRFLGIGPIVQKAPRWVTEGYATVVEARLTGYGRPHSDFRALLLRELAREGKMPSYGELNAFDRWMGGSFAYLVGSAYLEWLEERGPGTLQDLWARLTAKELRNFDDAFTGVFGDAPATLYARFVAELTHAALEIERARPPEDTLWMELSWSTGAPVVSPDGERIAMVVRHRDKPPKLVIRSIEVDEEAVEKREEAIAELLEADPEDVFPAKPRTQPRKVLHQRRHAIRAAVAPQWMPDGRALLFTTYAYDGDARLRPDLVLWEPESGLERRVTRHQDVRNAHPSPDGTFAVAVQQSWGQTRLVRVDLNSGAVEPLTDYDVGTVYDSPRLSPDGRRMAWLQHGGSGWDVRVRDLEDGSLTTLRRGGEGGPTYLHLAWGPDGTRLYGSVGVGGFIEVHTLLDDEGPVGQVTQTLGGAFFPAPAPDGEGLYFLSLSANGYALHHTPHTTAREQVQVEARGPVVRLPTPDPVALPERQEVLPTPYGLGRTEWRTLLGGAWSPSQAAGEVGVRAGDIAGRREAMLMTSWGGISGVTGAMLAGTYRGLPVEVVAEGFVATEGAELMQRYGGGLTLRRTLRSQDTALTLAVGGWGDAPLFEEATTQGLLGLDGSLIPDGVVVEQAPERVAGWAQARLAWREARGGWLGGAFEGRTQIGQTGGQGWGRAEGAASLWAGRKWLIQLDYVYGMSDTTRGVDRYRLGGIASSALPSAWQWSRITSPGFAVGSLRGSHRDMARVALETPVSVFAERHRMADGALGAQGATLVGLGGTFQFEPQPFGRIPGGAISSGLGCQVEDAYAGWATSPCRSLDDYRFWTSVTWRL